MTISYRPTPVPSDLPASARAWLANELKRVSQAIDEVQAVNLFERNAEPDKLDDGLIAYADGTNWNPGKGEGIYGYIAATWVSLSYGQLAPGGDETITGDWIFSGNVTLNGTVTGTGMDAYARLADNEVITGDWQHSGEVTFAKARSGDVHSFRVENTNPQVLFNDTNATATEAKWNLGASSDAFFLRTLASDGSNGETPIQVERSGTAVTSVNIASPYLTIQDVDGTGDTANPYLRFADSANTRLGYIGPSSTGDSDLDIKAEGGDIVLSTNGDPDVVRFLADARFNDNVECRFGSSSDAQVYYDSAKLVVNSNGSHFTNHSAGAFRVRDGAGIRAYDTTDVDYTGITHDGNAARLLSSDARSQMSFRTQGVAAEATVTFDWPDGNGGLVIICGGTTSSIAVNRSCILFVQGTSAPTEIWKGSVIATGATNPNTANFLNIWPSSATVLSVKNRLSTFAYITCYMFAGDT